MESHTGLLSAVANGVSGTIASVHAPLGQAGGNQIANRLGELGFLPGEHITLLRRGPGGKEPIAVQVGDTVFALRRIEADCVLVDLAGGKGAA